MQRYGTRAKVPDAPGARSRPLTCTFTDPQNPSRVAVLMDVADINAVMAATQTETMAEAMVYDGVLPETLVILVEA
jgi:hypothetical protein